MCFLKSRKNILSRAREGLFVAGCLKNKHIAPLDHAPMYQGFPLGEYLLIPLFPGPLGQFIPLGHGFSATFNP